MRVDKSKVRVRRLKDGEKEERPNLSPEQAWNLVWELTKEAYSLAGKDVERRLQRHIVRVIRGGKKCF